MKNKTDMKKTMKRAIEEGSPQFRAYARYVVESLPTINLPTLREMFKHNASVREYLAHMERIKKGTRVNPNIKPTTDKLQ